MIFNIAKRNITSCYPREWIDFLNTHRNTLNGNNEHYIQTENDVYIKTREITSQNIRDSLIKTFATSLTADEVADRFGVTNNCSWNVFTYQPSRDTYSKSVNYRIMTGSYTTRFKLFRFKIIDDPICPFCNEEEDDIVHAIMKCPLSKITWRNFIAIMKILGIDYELKPEDIIFGTPPGCKSRDAINTIMRSIKRILVDPNRDNRIITELEIMNMCKSQIKLELHADMYRAKNGLKTKFWAKWQNIYAKIKDR